MMYAVLNSQYGYVAVTNYVFSPDFGGFLLSFAKNTIF